MLKAVAGLIRRPPCSGESLEVRGSSSAPTGRLGAQPIFPGHVQPWLQLKRHVRPFYELPQSAALGGHVAACEKCGHTHIAYNSCRNRHCPKCQGAAARDWLAARQAELLPVEYYHLVFTLPGPIGDIAYHNKTAIYGILFKAAAETLITIAADPKHLDARIGLTAVLHTWGWAADISYIWTAQGWLYLAVMLDLYSRRVIGWAVGARMTSDLPLRALNRAIGLRQPGAGVIHHSDRSNLQGRFASPRRRTRWR